MKRMAFKGAVHAVLLCSPRAMLHVAFGFAFPLGSSLLPVPVSEMGSVIWRCPNQMEVVFFPAIGQCWEDVERCCAPAVRSLFSFGVPVDTQAWFVVSLPQKPLSLGGGGRGGHDR